MKLVILDGYTTNTGDLSWEGISSMVDDFTVYDRTAPKEVVERCAGAQLILTNKVIISDKTMSQLPELKYIGVMATGYNVVDIEAAHRRGIVVTNVPAYSTASVAQLVFAHLLTICFPVQVYSDAVHSGRWTKSPDFTFRFNLAPLIELQGLTMGIVGLGQIGSRVAMIANALGMKVAAYTSKSQDALPDYITKMSLDELFAKADVLSLHCPLTPETQGMVCAERLATMKPSAILINTGRGQLVVEEDLANALNAGTIRAAALDALSVEPPQVENPLLHARNCNITPHIAWATLEARKRLVATLEANVKAFLASAPQNMV